jgi:hypothetical protein
MEIFIGIYLLIGFCIGVVFVFHEWYRGEDVIIIDALKAICIFTLIWALFILYEVVEGKYKIKGRKK